MRNGSHRCRYFNIWFSVGDAVQGSLGGTTLVEEVHPSGWDFGLIYPHPTSSSLSILCFQLNMNSQLPVPGAMTA